jgi:hypothetical protein
VLKRESILGRKMCPKDQETMRVIVPKGSGDIDFNVLYGVGTLNHLLGVGLA